MSCQVIDIGPRSDSDTSYHSSQLVGNIISVQIQRCNNRIFFRDKQGILQESISNTVLNNNFSCIHSLSQCSLCRFFTQILLQLAILVHRKCTAGKLCFCHFIAPTLESSFGKFHNISLVYQCNRRQFVLQCVQDSCTHQTLRAFYRYRLYSERRSFGETYFLYPHLITQKSIKLLCFGSTLLPFYTGINIFCILTEDVHIHFLRFFNRRNYPTEPAYRTQANIQIECLT